MGPIPWTVVRKGSDRPATDADRYARREYGGPDARWLLSSTAQGATSARAASPPKPGHLGSWIRRATQAVAAIFLFVSLIPRQP